VSLLNDERARSRLAVTAATCLAGFVVVALLVRVGVTEAIDLAALQAISTLHGGFLDPVMVGISELGVADILGFFTMIPVGFLWSLGARLAAVFVGSAYYLGALLTDLVKSAFARPRPAASFQIPLKMPESEDLIWAALAVLIVIALWRTRYRAGALLGAGLFAATILIDPPRIAIAGVDAFPSGHALRSTVLVASLLIALPWWPPSRRVMVGFVAMLLAIGISRVYLGEHHPSDVVAGWLLGVAFITALALVPAFHSSKEAAALGAASRSRTAG
jgi:membrane-associated phospholipid phosphatase